VKQVACAALLLLASCAWLGSLRPTPAPTNAVLFFSADLHGYVEPCGCSENMRGGLSRTAGVLADAADAGTVLYFDSGDALFPSATIPEDAVGQQERKARAIADGFQAMGLRARLPGPLDDARGPAFHAALGLPELPASGVRLLEVGGHRVGVVTAPTLAAARPLAVQARSEGAVFVVALLPTSFEGALGSLSEAQELDLVIASRPKDILSAEQNKLLGATVKLAQVQNKGRSMLRVDLLLRDRGPTTWVKGSGELDRELATLDERIELMRGQVNEPGLAEELKALKKAKLNELVQRRAALAASPMALPATGNAATFRFVAIESSLPKEPTVEAIERAYNRDVGELNLRWAKEHGHDCAPATAEHPGFVGIAVCGSCHPEALKVWQGTKHAHAFEALATQGKQYHLDCIGCHVAGWQQPQGVCRVDETENRREVSCESCHGAGSAHVVAPTKATIRRGSAEACVGCHDHENSPHFEYQRYLPQIQGPGHGLPK
jgi:Cytochrome c554 and c-prime